MTKINKWKDIIVLNTNDKNTLCLIKHLIDGKYKIILNNKTFHCISKKGFIFTELEKIIDIKYIKIENENGDKVYIDLSV